MPAAERTRDVAVRELTLERRRPALAIGLVAAVDDGAVKLVDIGRRPRRARVVGRKALLRERIFGYEKLTIRDEAECRLVTAGGGECTGGDV